MNLDSQTVYPCEEHGEVAVPIQELLIGGRLDLYPEVSGRGYFDIDYRRGELVLRAKGYVGLIPLSDRVAIHVRPRAPIGNLMWMAWRAGIGPKVLEGYARGYDVVPWQVDDPEALYVDVFLRTLEDIARRGVLKRYRTYLDDQQRRGRFSVARTVERYYARGIRYRQVFERTDLTVDNPENQIIKYAALRVLRYLENISSRDAQNRARRARRHLEPLSTVDETAVDAALIIRRVEPLIRALPTAYRYYESALWLAYLIASRGAVRLERVGRARFESLIVDAAGIFEAYVRAVCVESQRDALRCSVHDGNRAPLTLFHQGVLCPIKPDIYFRRDGRTIAIADAKYKKDPSEQDRYEVLAYCEATRSRRAAFLCPQLPGQPRSSYLGTTAGGVRLEILRLDLAAANMEAEERRLVGAIAALLDRIEDGQQGAQPAAVA